jgi:hypothetical protein
VKSSPFRQRVASGLKTHQLPWRVLFSDGSEVGDVLFETLADRLPALVTGHDYVACAAIAHQRAAAPAGSRAGDVGRRRRNALSVPSGVHRR